MKVEILSKKLITPSSPTPPHLQTFKISSFDQLVAPIYATFTFYYSASDTTTEERNARNAERSKQLQKSLSEILTIFYPLGGRYIHDDEGAEYLEAKARSCSLYQLTQREEVEAELREQIIPYALPPPNGPSVAVQFTEFECGGVAIGVCVIHRFADGFTTLMFLDAWATASRPGIDQVRFQPSFDISSICPTRDMSSFKMLPPSEVEAEKIVRKRFVFNDLAVSKLRAIAKFSYGGEEIPKHQPTRVEAVSALIWKACIEVLQARRHGCSRPSTLVFALNMRGRTTVLPENSCGNLVRLAVSQEFKPNEGVINGQLRLGELAGKVHGAISSGFAECAEAKTIEDLFLMEINSMKEYNEILRKNNVDVFMLSSLCGFPLYEIDFGWGKPIWATTYHFPMEVIYLVDTKDGKGIEAWVSMEESFMLIFQQNPDIIAFTGRKPTETVIVQDNFYGSSRNKLPISS